MRAQEFLIERWTARTVRDYFDSKENKLENFVLKYLAMIL